MSDYVSSVQKMPDPYADGRRIRRAKVFAKAAELRYNAVKYAGQAAWHDLTDKDRQLWIDVQTESYLALTVAVREQHYTMLEFFLDGETPS